MEKISLFGIGRQNLDIRYGHVNFPREVRLVPVEGICLVWQWEYSGYS